MLRLLKMGTQTTEEKELMHEPHPRNKSEETRAVLYLQSRSTHKAANKWFTARKMHITQKGASICKKMQSKQGGNV